MQTLQLYIEGQRVDLFNDESIVITQTIQNVKDIAKVFTDFSKTFNLPASKTNNKIFKHYYNFNIENGYDARVKQNATIELNNVLFKKGKIKLEGVDLKNNKAYSYKVTFFGNTVNLKDLLGEDKLSALTWLSGFEKQYTATNVRTDLQALGVTLTNTIDSVSYTDAFCLPFITTNTRPIWDVAISYNPYFNTDGTINDDFRRGNLYFYSNQYKGLYYEELKYAIRVYLIVKAIEETYTGITFSSDSFFKDTTNDQFYELYMWMHKEKGFAFEATEVTNKYVNLPSDSSSMTRVISSPSSLTIFNLTGNQTLTYNLNVTSAPASDYSLEIYRNGALYQQSSLVGGTTGTALSGVMTNGNYEIYVTGTASETISLSWVITDSFLSESNTYVGSSQQITSNPLWNAQQQMPDMKIIDFITGLFKMFNLTAYVNDDNEIVVKTLDSYYQSGITRDITKYAEIDSISVSPVLPFKEVKFEYEGRGTKLAQIYEQEQGKGWGSEEYRIDNDILGDVYSVSLPFEHMHYDKIPSGHLVGYSIDDNEDAYIGKPLLFYRNLISTTTDISFLNSNVSVTSITDTCSPSNSVSLVASTDDDTCHFSIEQNEYTPTDSFDGSLFDNYYKTYIEEVYNTSRRLTKIKANLPTSFLLRYSLADKIQIVDRLYKINSIETNLQTGESTLELLNIVTSAAQVSPSVTTLSASAIQQTSATLNGQVTEAGTPAYTTRGFYWAVGSVTPTASDNNVVVSGTDTNPFTTNITLLTASTTYSFVAYATSSLGTVTGNVLTFTTSATQTLATVVTSGNTTPTNDSTTLSGNVTSVGVPNYTSKGFYYMQGTGTPTSSNLTLPVSGTSSGSYSALLSSLLSSTTYSYRAFAINTVGTAYGSTLTFTTAASTFAPSVTTNAATSVGTSSVVFEGDITNVGNPNYTVKGFVYVTGTGTPSLSNTIANVTVSGTTSGVYNASIIGLSSSQQYSYRAYATNSIGTTYGATQTFTTQSAATCSGGTLYFQNPVITGINASLGTGQISYGTGECGNVISPDLQFLFTNNEGEWLSTSQVTSIQLFEGTTDVSSQYTLGKTLNGATMYITVGGNFPSSSNDGDHTYSIHVSATNVDVYQTDITLPVSSDVANTTLSVYKDPTYDASKADYEGNNSILKPRGETGDTYRYVLTYTANTGYEFTGLGNITTPVVTPTGTGITSASATAYTSSTLTVVIEGAIAATDKAATVSYTGSPLAAPATSITSIEYKESSQSTYNSIPSGGIDVAENTSYDLKIVANGSYYLTNGNTSLIASISPTTNDVGGTQVHTIVIQNGLVGGGDLTGQVRIYPRASITLLDAVRFNFIDN